MPDHIDFLLYYLRHMASAHLLPNSPPISLPPQLKRWTVPKAPFVMAKSKEVFEMQTYRGSIQIYDAPLSRVRDWIQLLEPKLPSGIQLSVEYYEWESIKGLNSKCHKRMESTNQVGEKLDQRQPQSATPSLSDQILTKSKELEAVFRRQVMKEKQNKQVR